MSKSQQQISNSSSSTVTRNSPVAADAPGVATEAYIASLQIPHYLTLDTEGKLEHLKQFDALEMYNVLVDVKSKLASVKTENYVLTDFLEKNDPKRSIGLRKRINTASIRQKQSLSKTSTSLTPRSSVSNIRQSSSRRSTRSVPQSVSGYTLGSTKKGKVDYELTYKTKTEMTEKVCADVELKLKKLQDTATKDIKHLKANIEEMRCRKEETDETANNFILRFLTDQRDISFLETATEKQMERKFREFSDNWIKNARTLLGTMRLRITTLEESCQHHRSILIEKADYSGCLGAVDFEKLKDKRADHQRALKGKNTHMAGLRKATSKVMSKTSIEKKEMTVLENKSQIILRKTVAVNVAISKLDKEAGEVKEENKKNEKTISHLKKQLNRFDAPSVNEYMEQKNELAILEKEDKMLERKISILNLTLTNVLKRCKRESREAAPTSSSSSVKKGRFKRKS